MILSSFRGCALLVLFTLLLLPSCSKDSETFKPLDGASASDTNNLGDMSDLRDPDLSDPCDPNCHWDCFGGQPLCENGVVWSTHFGPIPCCRYDDPWPMPGPICGSEKLLQCKSSCIKIFDARYKNCHYDRIILPSDPLAEIARLKCQDTANREVGSSCQSDAECRPAKDTVSGRLICDLTTKMCKEVPRPTLDGYGGSCGTFTPPNTRSVITLDDGSICVVEKDFENNCWKQAKTLSCVFDEDCPVGSICLCDTNLQHDYKICGPENTDGSRKLDPNWLTCPK